MGVSAGKGDGGNKAEGGGAENQNNVMEMIKHQTGRKQLKKNTSRPTVNRCCWVVNTTLCGRLAVSLCFQSLC